MVRRLRTAQRTDSFTQCTICLGNSWLSDVAVDQRALKGFREGKVFVREAIMHLMLLWNIQVQRQSTAY